MKTSEKLEAVKNGKTSVEKRVAEQLKKIKEKDGEIRAFIDVFEEEALEKARKLDARIKKGEKVGRLAGLTIAVKNNICIKGKRATCSSKMLENYTTPYSATVIERILAEDCVIIGTTNLDEFACGSATINSAFFKTKNPRDVERVPGGSSGGSAAAVATGFADLALGSDTGGSIRCPASFCGVTGVKPTYGAVSRYGLIDLAMSLDQIGPLAPDVEGAALLLSVISGKDGKDCMCIGEKQEFELSGELKGVKVGLPKEFFDSLDEEMKKGVMEGVKALEKAGAQIVEVSIPRLKYVVPMYYLTMFAEFSSSMQKYDGLRYGAPADVSGSTLVDAVSEAREKSFGREIKRRILIGTYITTKEFKSEWYSQTLRARAVLREDFEKAFKKVDLIAGPAMPTPPWKFGEKSTPMEMYQADVYTGSANLAGIPAGVVPCAKIGKLPVAIQLHARRFEEKKLLNGLLVVQEEVGEV
ncbi:MAG: Asp-tRNA(Asn)/Glu-tRNA(Gln) amidotransferase subunit GatA [Candidatus Micrarchaeota archaeon]